MTNLASETIDARCCYFVRAIVGFRGVRPDHSGAPDDSKQTAFERFSPSGKVSDWIADRLADGPTGLVAWGRPFRLGFDTALALCNHPLTFLYVDVSMQEDRVKYPRQASH
jgi:hypothetical protein